MVIEGSILRKGATSRKSSTLKTLEALQSMIKAENTRGKILKGTKMYIKKTEIVAHWYTI